MKEINAPYILSEKIVYTTFIILIFFSMGFALGTFIEYRYLPLQVAFLHELDALTIMVGVMLASRFLLPRGASLFMSFRIFIILSLISMAFGMIARLV